MSVTGISSLSNSHSYEEMAEFWDTHDLTDFEKYLEVTDITFDPGIRRTAVDLDPDLYTQLQNAAQSRRISVQTLANLWLSQKLYELHLSSVAQETN